MVPVTLQGKSDEPCSRTLDRGERLNGTPVFDAVRWVPVRGKPTPSFDFDSLRLSCRVIIYGRVVFVRKSVVDGWVRPSPRQGFLDNNTHPWQFEKHHHECVHDLRFHNYVKSKETRLSINRNANCIHPGS